MKYRIWTTMNRTHLPREKARQYIEQVDEDIRRWVRVLYNENLEDPSLFDVTVNAGSLSVENTAQALLEFPGLPEFQATPASIQNLEDILLAARCRLAIGKDGRTHAVKATVHAERGKILVTYLPRQAREAESIPSILETMEGVESVHCTMATTNILYLGERFEPRSESFEHLIQISEKWNAAIELARFKCEPADAAVGNGTSPEDSPEPPGGMAPKPAGTATEPNGGIMDDDEGPARSLEMDPDASETMHRLIQAGRAGGFHYFRGDVSHPHGGLIGSGNYSLVVVGSVFASKGGASKRLKRDLVSLLSEKFRVPVIGTEELKSRYLFGRKQFLGLLACAAISFLIYSLLFEYQEPVLNFISKGHFDGGTAAKILAALAVGMFVPLVALTVGRPVQERAQTDQAGIGPSVRRVEWFVILGFRFSKKGEPCPDHWEISSFISTGLRRSRS